MGPVQAPATIPAGGHPSDPRATRGGQTEDPCPSSRDGFLDRSCSLWSGGETAREPGNDAGEWYRQDRRTTHPVRSHPNNGWVLWAVDASSSITITSVSAGQSVCGAPRRNRTGDPILTIDGRPLACAGRPLAALHDTAGEEAYRR